MIECDDYDCALDMLKNASIVNTAYYIIAGVNTGAVITRNQTHVLDIETLGGETWKLV